MPKKLTPYDKLSPSSRNRIAGMLDKIYKSGLTTTEVKKLSDSEFKTKLGITQKIGTAGFKGQRSLVRQITLDQKRRLGSSDIVLQKYAKIGKTLTELRDIKKGLIKSSGAGFYEITKAVRKNTTKTLKESYVEASKLLKIPKSAYGVLDLWEVEVLDDYGSP